MISPINSSLYTWRDILIRGRRASRRALDEARGCSAPRDDQRPGEPRKSTIVHDIPTGFVSVLGMNTAKLNTKLMLPITGGSDRLSHMSVPTTTATVMVVRGADLERSGAITSRAYISPHIDRDVPFVVTP